MKSESRRARILKMVLDFINSGDWEEGDGFLIFGSEAYDRRLGIEPNADESNGYFDELLRRLASEIKKTGGADSVAKRISLSHISRGLGDIDLTSFFDGLGADQKAQLLRTLSSVAEELVRRPKPGTETFRDISDEIDASLAAEAVEQLEHSYRRVLTLDEMTTPPIAFDGSEYFEEAHRCELKGQKIAAAVLCRAVLEAALISATDQDGWIKSQMNPRHSYIEAMLLQARLTGSIDGSRFTHGLRVRDAGNAAIHDLLQFHSSFSGKISVVIDDTRKILEDLFGSTMQA